jgi:hypothetical protein
MTGLLSSIREWWRWQMRRRRVHIHGIAEFRMLGTVVAFDRGRWVIDGEDGRPVHVEGNHPNAAGIRIGDRVEVEPLSPSTFASPMASEYRTIVRTLASRRT